MPYHLRHLLAAATCWVATVAWTQESNMLPLPPPQMRGAADGSTAGAAIEPRIQRRADSGKRTAPSACDWREIDVYVVRADAAYVYVAPRHALRLMVQGDLRAKTGTQDFPAQAPLNLVYVADTSRMGGAGTEQQELYSATDAGFIAQNGYLFCAHAGLATVVRGSIGREALTVALGLKPSRRIILAQSVGYPAGKP